MYFPLLDIDMLFVVQGSFAEVKVATKMSMFRKQSRNL
jgi:hypothetical protein